MAGNRSNPAQSTPSKSAREALQSSHITELTQRNGKRLGVSIVSNRLPTGQLHSDHIRPGFILSHSALVTKLLTAAGVIRTGR
jgi:hypothetical protein